MATLDTIKANIADYSTIEELAVDVISETKDTTFKQITDNLIAINEVKKEIKKAVNEKETGAIKDTDKFSDYPERIRKIDLGFNFEEGMTFSYWDNKKTKTIAESFVPDYTDFHRMFYYATGVDGTLDLSGWLAKPSNLDYTFANSPNITKVIMDGWDFTNEPVLNYTFQNTPKLETLSLKTKTVTEDEVEVTHGSFQNMKDATGFTNADALQLVEMEGTTNADKENVLNILKKYNEGWYQEGEDLKLFGIGYAGGTIYTHVNDSSSLTKSATNNSEVYKYAPLGLSKNPTTVGRMFSGMTNTDDPDSPSATTTVKYIDIRRLNTSEATNFGRMFMNNQYLRRIDGLATMDTSKSANFYRVLQMCSNLTTLNDTDEEGHIITPRWVFTQGVATGNFDYMFYNCINLKNLDLSKVTWPIFNTTSNLSNTFYKLRRAEWIDLGAFKCQNVNIDKITNNSIIAGWSDHLRFIKYDPSLTEPARRRLITMFSANSYSSFITNHSSFYFSNESGSSRSLYTSDSVNNNQNFLKSDCVFVKITGTSQGGTGSIKYALGKDAAPSSSSTWTRSYVYDGEMAVVGWRDYQYLENMFCGPGVAESDSSSPNANIVELDFTNFWARSVKTYWRALKQLINLKKVTQIGRMFSNELNTLTNCRTMICLCVKLKSIDFSTDIESQFIGVDQNGVEYNLQDYKNLGKFIKTDGTELTEEESDGLVMTPKILPGPRINTDTVTDMGYFLSNNYQLEEAKNLTLFNVSKVTDFYRIFQNNYMLKSIDISTWVPSSATNMEQMFANDAALESIDMSNWNTSKATSYSNMFMGCDSLKWIKVANCTSATKTFLQNRLKENGFTFNLNNSARYLVKAGQPDPEL